VDLHAARTLSRRAIPCLFALIICVGCGVGDRVTEVGSPFTHDDRPLAERLAEHRAELPESTVPLNYDETGTAPEALAFADVPSRVASDDIADRSELVVSTSPIGLVLRGGPGRQHRELLTIPADAVIPTTGNRHGEWTHVEYGVYAGWVYTSLLAYAPPGVEQSLGSEPAEATGEILRVVGKTEGAGLNMRVEPTLDSDIIGLLPGGATVEKIGGPEGPWVQVTHNGFVGWAWAAYMESVN
jgi:uncharacterized protein YraI